jgi:hypothetical protein
MERNGIAGHQAYHMLWGISLLLSEAVPHSTSASTSTQDTLLCFFLPGYFERNLESVCFIFFREIKMLFSIFQCEINIKK